MSDEVNVLMIEKVRHQYTTEHVISHGYSIHTPGFGPPKRGLHQCVITHHGYVVRKRFCFFAALKFIRGELEKVDHVVRKHQERRFETNKPRAKRKKANTNGGKKPNRGKKRR